MNDILIRLAPALALCLAVPAVAEPRRADPADAKASAPVLHYRSAFAGYKPWQDITPGNWRELNDKVAPRPASSPAGQRPPGARP